MEGRTTGRLATGEQMNTIEIDVADRQLFRGGGTKYQQVAVILLKHFNLG